MIILTGGAGFIGSAILAKLNAEGIDDILVVDNLGHSMKWKNLLGKSYEDYSNRDEFLELLVGDSLGDSVEAVIHMGACTSTTETDAEYLMDNNYQYTRALAEFCLEKDIRFIYASSAAVYGDGNLGFSDNPESTPSYRPLNMYGYSKQLFDLWALQNGVLDSIAGLRFFNVFGPNEYHKGDMRSVVSKAFEQVRDTAQVKLFKSYREDYADGEQKRDFVYVKDCVEVVWWLLEHPAANGIFNLGAGQARSWNDLAKCVFAAMEVPLAVEYIDMPMNLRPQYQYFTEADMSALRKAGYEAPVQSLEEAAQDYVRQYLLPGAHL